MKWFSTLAPCSRLLFNFLHICATFSFRLVFHPRCEHPRIIKTIFRPSKPSLDKYWKYWDGQYHIKTLSIFRLLFALFIVSPKPRKGPQRTFQYFKSPIEHNWIEIYFSKARLTRLFECLGSRIDECFGQLLTPIHLCIGPASRRASFVIFI